MFLGIWRTGFWGRSHQVDDSGISGVSGLRLLRPGCFSSDAVIMYLLSGPLAPEPTPPADCLRKLPRVAIVPINKVLYLICWYLCLSKALGYRRLLQGMTDPKNWIKVFDYNDKILQYNLLK